jgi:serine/threonine protein kinase/Tfp pilus assembly protein PilF
MGVKCPKCQHENPDDTLFCGKCGTQIPSPEKAEVTVTLETPKEELTRGTTLANRYEIIEELGKGGMGRVYRVEDTKLKQEVALKLIKPEVAKDKKTIERFRNELKLARNIRHKNVCGMFDLGEVKGTHFITMEYIRGEDLKSFIYRSGQLAVGTAIRIAKQVCEGLSEAHRLGVVHRDLKSNNIMIDREGNVRIMDFGIARSLEAKGITGAGVMIGTPEYMSPEQVEGKEVDRRSDLYSLGVILYEMVTGGVPFEGDTPFSVGVRQKSEIPKDPKELNVQIPDNLSGLILRCLEKEKDKRYQSAEEILHDLEDIKKEIPETRHSPIPKKPPALKRLWRPLRKSWILVAVLFFLALVLASAYLFFWREKPAAASGKTMLVVLPFENLGTQEDEYFADGITEEITSRLASFEELGVISRHSAVQYKRTAKTIKQIGNELDVDYVLEGTVRWDKSGGGKGRVRVTPQLIRVSDDTHIWAEAYEQELEGIFSVQSRIAEQVISQLNITLLTPRPKGEEAPPTGNMDAYQAYLRGLQVAEQEMYSPETRQLEVQMFKRAVELDPSFALAYARLSRAHSSMVNLGFDRSGERVRMARQAADKALELQPELPEAQLALGYYYYYALLDYDRALEVLSDIESRLPNAVEILMAKGYILRRMGAWEESSHYLMQALKLSPRDAGLMGQLGVTLMNMRRYDDALEYINRSIVLTPDDRGSYLYKAMLYIYGFGDLEKSRTVLKAMPQRKDSISQYFWFLQHLWERNYNEALENIASMPRDIFESQTQIEPKQGFQGLVYYLMGERERSREAYEAALATLVREAEKSPEDFRIHMALGRVHAGLGNKEQAIKEGKRGVELLPVSKNALHGPYQVMYLAHIYTMVGEQSAALDQLEYLMSISCSFSVHYLRIDPELDPLRDNPRFKRLLEQRNSSRR